VSVVQDKVTQVKVAQVKVTWAMLLLVVACDLATAQNIPLPRPRPAPELPNLSEPPQPSACRLRLTSDVAIAPSLPPITGPGECEAQDVVRLEAVVLRDRSLVAISPPAELRCTMAEAIADWVRGEVAPRTLDLGSPLKSVVNLTSFDCRGRNGIAGAKLSEHGRANALDIHSLRLANGKLVELTDPHVPRDFRESLRNSACARFTTVLGPGADGFHEDHIHVDVLERRGGYRICEWDVREPGEAPADTAIVASVPLPRARPAIDSRNRPR
jgi:hypothetical protein